MDKDFLPLKYIQSIFNNDCKMSYTRLSIFVQVYKESIVMITIMIQFLQDVSQLLSFLKVKTFDMIDSL